MYEIEGWTNNAGSGTLNYYDYYNNPSTGGYEEALNYVPAGTSYSLSGGYTSPVATTSTTPTSSGLSLTPYVSSSTGTTTTPSYITGGGASRAGSIGSLSPSYQYVAPQLLGSTSTTSYSGGGTLPTMTAPTYNLPEYDYGRINYLAQQQAAPLYTKARNALTTGIGKIASTDNPYMQAQARKQLMSGYGGGLSEIASGAAKTAAQLYAPEYAGQMQKATSEYGGQLTAAQANFQAALAEWQKSLVQTTTTTNQYSNAGAFNTATGTMGSTTGGYKPSGVKYSSPYYGKTYASYDDYIASGDYLWNRRL